MGQNLGVCLILECVLYTRRYGMRCDVLNWPSVRGQETQRTPGRRATCHVELLSRGRKLMLDSKSLFASSATSTTRSARRSCLTSTSGTTKTSSTSRRSRRPSSRRSSVATKRSSSHASGPTCSTSGSKAPTALVSGGSATPLTPT